MTKKSDKQISLVQNQDKKHKKSTADTAIPKIEIQPTFPVMDTPSIHTIQEIITETPHPVDTSVKNAVSPKNNSKKKNGKTKNTQSPAPENPKSDLPMKTKTDSLKQQ